MKGRATTVPTSPAMTPYSLRKNGKYMVMALARILSTRRLSFKHMLAFFLLIGNTWTLVALVADNLNGLLGCSYRPCTWGFIHHISTLVVIAYMITFTQKQEKVSFGKQRHW